MHIFHCWHKIEGSERKIKSNSKCQKSDQYIQNGSYILYTVQQQCCICGKVQESPIYRDYDIFRASKYKSE